MKYYYRYADAKSELLHAFRVVVENNEEDILRGALESENMSLLNNFEEPYQTISEWKEYDPEGYEQARHDIQLVINFIMREATITSDGIIVYRSLVVPDVDDFIDCLLSGNCSVGKFWSFEEASARPYWKNRKGPGVQIQVKLSGILPISSIDVLETLFAHTKRSLSAILENEITAIPNSKVFIDTISYGSEVEEIHKRNRI